MADVYTRIGYIKGATGATGAQGAKGDQGDAATIAVGTVTTVPYGQTANVVNSGTSGAAVFDFTIPQGRPGEQTTDMQNLTLGSITTSSASFPVPAVGETGKVLWGKVVKWFSDMSALVATKLNAANVVNNLTTTNSGYALDARQGKALVTWQTGTVTPNTGVTLLTTNNYTFFIYNEALGIGFLQVAISESSIKGGNIATLSKNPKDIVWTTLQTMNVTAVGTFKVLRTQIINGTIQIINPNELSIDGCFLSTAFRV